MFSEWSSKLGFQIRTSNEKTKSLRENGRVPGILYGKNQENHCLSVSKMELKKALQDPQFPGALLNASLLQKSENFKAYAIQYDKETGEPIHIDFLRA